MKQMIPFKKQYFYSLLLLSLAVIGSVHGQKIGPGVSGNVNSIGKHSVDCATGTLNYSIPIETIEQGGVQVPISLVYSSAAMRLDQKQGSRVGIGWNLSAGGVITRTMRGSKPDEKSAIVYSPVPVTDQGITNEYLKTLDLGGWDGENDIFQLSLPGYSSSFIIKRKNPNNLELEAIPLSYTPLKIEIINCLFDIASFKVVDPNGNTYLFSDTDVTRISGTCSEETKVTDNSYISAWHLSMITSAEGDKIHFGYSTSFEREAHESTCMYYYPNPIIESSYIDYSGYLEYMQLKADEAYLTQQFNSAWDNYQYAISSYKNQQKWADFSLKTGDENEHSILDNFAYKQLDNILTDNVMDAERVFYEAYKKKSYSGQRLFYYENLPSSVPIEYADINVFMSTFPNNGYPNYLYKDIYSKKDISGWYCIRSTSLLTSITNEKGGKVELIPDRSLYLEDVYNLIEPTGGVPRNYGKPAKYQKIIVNKGEKKINIALNYRNLSGSNTVLSEVVFSEAGSNLTQQKFTMTYFGDGITSYPILDGFGYCCAFFDDNSFEVDNVSSESGSDFTFRYRLDYNLGFNTTFPTYRDGFGDQCNVFYPQSFALNAYPNTQNNGTILYDTQAYGFLQKVTISGGGIEEFEYESNTLNSGTLKNCGGMRLKAVSQKDNAGVQTRVQYNYNTFSGSGSGYVDYSGMVTRIQSTPFGDQVAYPEFREAYPFVQSESSSNNGMWYSMVEEITPGLGKTISVYPHVNYEQINTTQNGANQNFIHPFNANINHLLLAQYVINEDGQLLKADRYRYSISQADLNLIKASGVFTYQDPDLFFSAQPSHYNVTDIRQIKADPFFQDSTYLLGNPLESMKAICITNEGVIFSNSYYYDIYLPNIKPRCNVAGGEQKYLLTFADENRLLEKESFQFDPDAGLPDCTNSTNYDYLISGNITPMLSGKKYIRNTVQYAYDNPIHSFPTRIISANSVGDTLTERRKYPQDYLSTANNAIALMVQKNMISSPIETQLWKKKSGQSSFKLYLGKLTQYEILNTDTLSFVAPTREYLLEPDHPLDPQQNEITDNLGVNGNYAQLFFENNSLYKENVSRTFSINKRTLKPLGEQKTNGMPVAIALDPWGTGSSIKAKNAEAHSVGCTDLNILSKKRDLFPYNLTLGLSDLLTHPVGYPSYCHNDSLLYNLAYSLANHQTFSAFYSSFIPLKDFFEPEYAWCQSDSQANINALSIEDVYHTLLSNDQAYNKISVIPSGSRKIVFAAVVKSKNATTIDADYSIRFKNGTVTGGNQSFTVDTARWTLCSFTIDPSNYSYEIDTVYFYPPNVCQVGICVAYPQGAMIEATSYNEDNQPIAVFDQQLRPVYSNYDKKGRLTTVTNEKGEILKSYSYHVKDQSVASPFIENISSTSSAFPCLLSKNDGFRIITVQSNVSFTPQISYTQGSPDWLKSYKLRETGNNTSYVLYIAKNESGSLRKAQISFTGQAGQKVYYLSQDFQ